MSEWKFADSPNVAVIVDRRIANREDWIARVSHDADDGAWQFHTGALRTDGEIQAMLISLRAAVQLDPSIVEIADLPLGWRAWRDTPNSAWQRERLGPD